MIVALAAAGFKNGDISYNKARMAEVIRGLSGRADLVVFGETFLQGFDSLSWNYEEDRSVALSADDPIILEIRQEAKSNGIAVSFGYIEKAGEALYSSQLTVGADGQIRLVRWESDGNSYSLSFNSGDNARPGLTPDQVTSLVNQIG